jgi:hypothetical protein
VAWRVTIRLLLLLKDPFGRLSGVSASAVDCLPSTYAPSSFSLSARSLQKMKELAAYLLLVLGGKAQPSSDDVKAVLTSIGAEASEEELSRVLTAVEGKVGSLF